jgi:hypothetical protein
MLRHGALIRTNISEEQHPRRRHSYKSFKFAGHYNLFPFGIYSCRKKIEIEAMGPTKKTYFTSVV